MKNALYLFCLLVIVFLGFKVMNSSKKDHLIFSSAWLPYSADPIEYDASIHHNAFTSIFGTLTSASKRGEVVPLIAKRWEHDSSGKHWSFDIRDDLFYSNGDKITAQDYALSLRRIAFLMKRSNSHSGVMEFLKDFDGIRSIEDVGSIYSKGNSLHFEFSTQMPDLPYKIAFGFYALIHPSMFNHITGEWLSTKPIISSHNYKVSKWTPDDFELSLRTDLKDFNYQKAVKKITFVNLNTIKEAKELENVDIAIADKQSLMFDSSFKYVGSNEGFNIGYVQCYGWHKNANPLHDLKLRKWLRYKFYKGLQENGFNPETSFFPIELYGGIQKNRDFSAEAPTINNIKLVTHTLKSGPKIKENSNRLTIQEIVNRGLLALKDNTVFVEQIDYSNSMKIDEVMSLAVNGTAIDADAFVDTARFMFVSKHGANLPDQTGKILEELKKEKPNLDLINEEIWDQAIIWPILHYSSGHWIKKSSAFNFDEVNFDLPALDFSFIRVE